MVMLFNDKILNNLPLGSVRSSGRIGTVTGVVINPNNLHVDAFKCRVLRGQEQLLSPLDVRNLSPRGIVINDHDNLLDEEDAIRLKNVLKINFQLIGKTAFVGKRKVGQVDGYAVDSESMFIQKIYVTPGFIARFKSDRLTYDRSLVKEIDDKKIVFENTNLVREKVRERVGRIERLTIPQPSANASLTSENE